MTRKINVTEEVNNNNVKFIIEKNDNTVERISITRNDFELTDGYMSLKLLEKDGKYIYEDNDLRPSFLYKYKIKVINSEFEKDCIVKDILTPDIETVPDIRLKYLVTPIGVKVLFNNYIEYNNNRYYLKARVYKKDNISGENELIGENIFNGFFYDKDIFAGKVKYIIEYFYSEIDIIVWEKEENCKKQYFLNKTYELIVDIPLKNPFYIICERSSVNSLTLKWEASRVYSSYEIYYKKSNKSVFCKYETVFYKNEGLIENLDDGQKYDFYIKVLFKNSEQDQTKNIYSFTTIKK